MEQITLNVKGMSCGHCVKAIESNVRELAGVKNVTVLLQEGKVEVAFNPNEVSLDKIKDVIDDQGYDVI